MGRGLGLLQTQILEAIEKDWEAGNPIVRLVPLGTNRRTRKKLLQAARRLRDRGLVQYAHIWDKNSRDRSALIVCLCPPGMTVFSEKLGKEIPISELDEPSSRKLGLGMEKLGKKLSRDMAASGIHVGPYDALNKGLAGDDPTEELSLEERIDRLQAKLDG